MRLRCHLTWLNHDQTSHQHICSNCQLDICHDFHKNNIVHNKTQRIKITRVGKKKRKKEKKNVFTTLYFCKMYFLQLHSVKVNVCQNKFKFCHHLFIPMSNQTQMTSSLKKYKKRDIFNSAHNFCIQWSWAVKLQKTYIHTLPLKS